MSDSEPETLKKSPSQDSIESEVELKTPVGCFHCRKEGCSACWCSFNNYWRAIGYFAIVVVYLLIGGGIFTAAERPTELQAIENAEMEREEAQEALDNLKRTLVFTITNNSNLTIPEATDFLENLVSASTNLSTALQPVMAEVNGPIWDFSSAVFFASTVITTIGYGTIAPATSAGQILFIFYAIIGIPIALLFLSVLGQIISDLLEAALEPCTKRFGKDSVTSRTIYFGLLILVTLIFFIIIPAVIYNVIEEWNFRESIYYCFVTLTTVGFGDFVPSQAGSSQVGGLIGFYKLCSTIWMWIGLAMVAALITEMQNLIEAFGKRIRKSGCLRKGAKMIRDKRTNELKEVPKEGSSPVREQEEGEEDEERLTTGVEGEGGKGQDV